MKTTRIRRLLAVCALPLLAAACEDLTLAGGGTVAGLVIEDSQGAVLATVSGGTAQGTLRVRAGTERTLRIRLLGAGGSPLALQLDQTLRLTVVTTVVADWQATGDDEGILRGRSPGRTAAQVDVLTAGSSTYASPLIGIEVE